VVPRRASASTLILASVVLLAFVVRIVWIAHADYVPTLSDDAGRYDFLGRSLANGGGYTNPNGNTTLFWPPGYPFLLTAIYKLCAEAQFGNHEVTAALVFNAAAGALTCIFVYALARRMVRGSGRSATAGLAGALLYALLPSAVFFAGVTLTETWFTFLSMLAVYLLVVGKERASWPVRIAAAIVIGYAALVRGQALLLPVAAIPFWYATWRAGARDQDHGAAIRHVGGIVTATAALVTACVMPWMIRNYAESGAFVAIASNSGVDFYIGHSEDADGRGRIVNELVFRYPERQQADAEALVSRDGFREGLEFALKHPWREVELSARKVFFLYYSDHSALAWTDAHGERPFLAERTRDALAVISNVYYYIVMGLAAAGIVVWFARRPWGVDPIGILLLSVAGYFTLVHVAFFADPRFHAPLMPIACIWAAMALAAVLSARSEA
jgi:hypothetical protein